MERGSVDLTSLTLIAGANSAGKSSLLQSLLLLGQSNREDQVTLNGQLVSLGEPRDVIRRTQESTLLSYEITVPRFLGRADDLVAARLELRLGASGDELRLESVSLTVAGEEVFEGVLGRPTENEKTIQAFGVRRPGWGPESSVALLRAQVPRSESRLTLRLEVAGLFPQAVHQQLHPRSRSRLIAELVEEAKARPAASRELLQAIMRYRNSTHATAPEHIRAFVARADAVTARSAVRDLSEPEQDLLIRYLEKSGQFSWQSFALGRRGSVRPYSGSDLSRFPSSEGSDPLEEALYYLSFACSSMVDLAESIVYLGPLRDEPRVVYAMGRGTAQTPVGAHGEFMADYLARGKDRSVTYRSPEGEVADGPLLHAVSTWVNYLGIGDSLSVTDMGKLGRTVRLRMNGVDRDLTTVGVGASQLLPVVVAILGAPAGSILLFEQPELHLHPAVQSRLGDFLASARDNIAIVVETHSEYIVNRVRLRVAQQRIDPEHICILFGEQADGVSAFRRLQLNKYGDLSEWPRGFFDYSESDSALIVQEISRRLAASDG